LAALQTGVLGHPSMSADSRAEAGLCLLFFLSGVASLLFENLWFYQAGLTLGNSVWASSLVLAGFMGGLALGNALAARFGGRVRRALRVYAALELAIGLTGVALVWGLPSLTPALAALLGPVQESPWIANSLRLATALVLLLIPASAMGATLPILVRALSRRDPRFGRVLGLLYGWNVLGAVVGALAGEMLLIEHLGIRGTGLAALGFNVLAALAALTWGRRFDVVVAAPAPLAPGGRRLEPRARLALAVAALSGFLLLALEVIWFRFMVLFTFGTSSKFALLLAVVLAGIALGGLAGARLAGRHPRAEQWLSPSAFASAVAVVVLYAVFPGRPQVSSLWEMTLLSVVLMLPVALLSGILFTLLGEFLHRQIEDEARVAGLLTLANTAGAMLGALAGGFILLPHLGMERSLWLAAAGYALAGCLLWGMGLRPVSRLGHFVGLAAAVAGLAAVVLFPRGVMERRHLAQPIGVFEAQEGSRPIAIRESLTDTLIYMRRDLFGEPLYYRLVTNGFTMTGTNIYGQRYMKIFVYLPVALRPQLRSALLISYGVGMTAKALTDTASLESIDVVDISSDVIEMGRLVHPPGQSYPIDDPRVRVHVEDGRHFLQTTQRRFDLITGEPPPPELAGVVSLYTREYFALMRERLSDDGVASYWLPVHSLAEGDVKAIIRAFCDVFDDCTLWNAAGFNWMLMGTRGTADSAVDLDGFRAQWRDSVVAPTLRDVGLERPEQLGALFMAGPDDLAGLTAGTDPLVDDWPKRLMADQSQAQPSLEVFMDWRNTDEARARFERSPWVKANWPETLRDETLPYFDIQAGVNTLMLPATAARPPDLAEAHRFAEDWGLSTIPLWVLQSNALRQRAASIAAAKWRTGPRLELELGLGDLARRDYAVARQRFERAQSGGVGLAGYLEIYAGCMADADSPWESSLATLEQQDHGRVGAVEILDAVRAVCAARSPTEQ
jgi:spermidine synthase